MLPRVSTDKKELDLHRIFDYISKKSYWGQGRTIEQVQTTIENSLCFGLYLEQEQVGFGRVVTDYTIFAYLMDVVIFEPFRGMGYGKLLVRQIMDHPVLKRVGTIGLKTKDAHGFYEGFGFERIGDSPLWMALDRIKLL